MKLTTMANCPYCGYTNSFTAEKTHGRELHNCHLDMGGCDGDFVVEYAAKLTATVKRVEGEEKHAADRQTETDTAPAPIDGRVKFGEIPIGGRFIFGGVVWVKLEHSFNKARCLALECVTDKAFDEGNCNDWSKSTLRQWLNNDFLKELCDHETREHGNDPNTPDPLEPIISDLTADDGTKDYGAAEDYIALLTCDLYRLFRDIIPPVDNWYWTLTPWSCHPDFSRSVRLVRASGALGVSNAFHGDRGVRPLINLKSEIFVSTVGDAT